MSRTATTERSPRVSSGLWLLLLALAAGIGAYALVGLGKRGRVPPSIELYGSLIAAGFIGAWFVVRKVARRADPVLLPAAALLSALGFAVIWRLKPDLAVEQVTWLGVGLVAFVLTLVLIRDDRMLDAYTYTIGLAGFDPAAAPDRPRARPDDQRRASLGGDRTDLVPAGRVRQGPDRHLPGVLPGGQARDARGRAPAGSRSRARRTWAR